MKNKLCYVIGIIWGILTLLMLAVIFVTFGGLQSLFEDSILGGIIIVLATIYLPQHQFYLYSLTKSLIYITIQHLILLAKKKKQKLLSLAQITFQNRQKYLQ